MPSGSTTSPAASGQFQKAWEPSFVRVRGSVERSQAMDVLLWKHWDPIVSSDAQAEKLTLVSDFIS